MSTQSYIKDLVTFSPGRVITFPIVGGTDTVTCTYTTPLSYVGMSNMYNVDPVGDGTGIAELWRYRTQFEINPNTTGTYPTSPGVFPGRLIMDTNAVGSITGNSIDLQSASQFYTGFVANHTSKSTPPYKFSNFRGAETFYTTFVGGSPETAADRVRNYPSLKSALVALLKFNAGPFKRWWACSPNGFWRTYFKIVATAVAFAIDPVVGIATAIVIWGEKRDKKRCYTYNYHRNGHFTIKVNGGYGPVGRFRITLIDRTRKEPIAQRVVDENTNVTFSNLKGSNSGEGGIDIGPYTVNILDVRTNVGCNVKVHVPYGPYGDVFGVSNEVLKSGFPMDGSPFIPSNLNAFWVPAIPAVATGVPSGELQEPFFDSDVSTCLTTRNTAYCFIEASPIDVTYQFAFRIPPITTWTFVDTPTVVPATDLTFGKTVSAAFTTPSNALSGLWKVDLKTTLGSTTLNTIVNFDGSSGPATFEIYNPTTDFNMSSGVLIGPTKTTRNVTGAGGIITTVTDYEFQIKTSVCCCTSTSLTAYMYKANLNDIFWDQTLNTAFAANSSNLPSTALAGAPTTLNSTLPGDPTKSQIIDGTDGTALFKFKILDGTVGDVYTFFVRSEITPPPFDGVFTPRAFFETVQETDPTTGITTTDIVRNYNVVTLA